MRVHAHKLRESCFDFDLTPSRPRKESLHHRSQRKRIVSSSAGHKARERRACLLAGGINRKGQVSRSSGHWRRGSFLAGHRLSNRPRKGEKTLSAQADLIQHFEIGKRLSHRQSSAKWQTQSHSPNFFFRQVRFQSVAQLEARENVQESINDVLMKRFHISVPLLRRQSALGHEVCKLIS